MKSLCLSILALAFLVGAPIPASATQVHSSNISKPLPNQATLRRWVQEMKQSRRGPFKRIRWFCADGTLQPPVAYACRERGGGVQHGEWTDRVKRLRADGYFLGTVFADLEPDFFLMDPRRHAALRQMILEQFLIGADDGWILRKAQYYRGALQAEDETASGLALLGVLVAEPRMLARDFLVLREAVRFFPHGRIGTPISEMRQLSRTLAEQDAHFEALRIKIHVKPQPADAAAVRRYARRKARPERAAEYERLATVIDAVFRHRDISTDVAALAEHVRQPELATALRDHHAALQTGNTPWDRFTTAARLMAALREHAGAVKRPTLRLRIIDLGLALEADLFQGADALLSALHRASRRERIQWLKAAAAAVYGSGLISGRQWHALQDSFQVLDAPPLTLIAYKTELDYISRVPTWADRSLRFQFAEAVETFAVLEPRSRSYLHDRLRGSLLLFYADVLNSLRVDVGQLLGIQNSILNRPVGAGFTALNPGLARGIVRVYRRGDRVSDFDAKGIYVLPATFEDLPPVAGILTAGEGNMLSHVQLLARNLGVPNVAVAKTLLPEIKALEGRQVVLAVSPKGIVQVLGDSPEWDTLFTHNAQSPQLTRIQPDLAKLDLRSQKFFRLSELRATASGRICGPKAANLGELKHFFPESVTEGLIVPFGAFRSFLDKPIAPDGPPAYHWMQDQYAKIDSLAATPKVQRQAIHRYLKKLRAWIMNTDPGNEFRLRLKTKLRRTFGPDGSYGVFVRSDTNVEDLPGFTGAGLNKTVPHVVGEDNIIRAIQTVWASPFSERAYRWRQGFMKDPEHVYASALLMKSVPADKSGVMVTADIDSGESAWLSIAVNEGVGGAVAGQTAEELRYHRVSGRVRLFSHATEPRKRVLRDTGGINRVWASGTEAVLSDGEISQLVALARDVPRRFPHIINTQGKAVPADIEFGFHRNRLALFQIRPFLESDTARQNLYLNQIDQPLHERYPQTINIHEIPGKAGR